MLREDVGIGNEPSMIEAKNKDESSLFFRDSHSFLNLPGLDEKLNVKDEYDDDDDVGFDLYEVGEADFPKVAQ